MLNEKYWSEILLPFCYQSKQKRATCTYHHFPLFHSNPCLSCCTFFLKKKRFMQVYIYLLLLNFFFIYALRDSIPLLAKQIPTLNFSLTIIPKIYKIIDNKNWKVRCRFKSLQCPLYLMSYLCRHLNKSNNNSIGKSVVVCSSLNLQCRSNVRFKN